MNQDNSHQNFIKRNFVKVENEEITKILPSVAGNSDDTDKTYKVIEWYEFKDNKIYMPLLEIDESLIFSKRCYCGFCKSWINSRYKVYFIDQHLNTDNHNMNVQLREYQENDECGAGNANFVGINIILHILLEAKPISNVESRFFTCLCPNLPNRDALTKAILNLTGPFKEILKKVVSSMSTCYLCIDEWSDKMKRNFLGVTAHGIIENQNVKNVIYFRKINPMKVTGQFLQDIVKQILKEYNIENNFNGIISDNASNMISGFDNDFFKRRCCISHTLNLILKDIHDMFLNKINILDSVRARTKNSSLFAKTCEFMGSTISKLPSYSTTRWNSLHDLIHSFNMTNECIKTFYDQKKLDIPFDQTDEEFFQEFELLLKYFRDSIDMFESDKFGQICKAQFELKSLKESVLRFIKNSEFFKEHAKDIESSINQRLEMINESWGDEIYAAAFLHPNHIFSNILSENEQEKGINYLHHLLSELSDEEESNPFQGETSSQKEYLITHPIINEKVDELQVFLQQSPSKECNLLEYWNRHSEQFPKLSKIAIKILSIPTSSAGIERVFSIAKELLGNKQLRMNKELVEIRMLILGNQEIFEDFFKENLKIIFPQLCDENKSE